jgi:hypothetical protein
VDVDVVRGDCVEEKGATHLTFVGVNVKACKSFDGGPDGVMPAQVKLGTSDGQFVHGVTDFANG